MKPLLAILCASVLNAATVTVCSSGCTTTSLQTALDTLAACGDTIQIKSTETQTGNFTITYRGCTGGTPITVTSDRATTYLSNASARVTPSQLGNMAQIVSPNTNPALAGALDGMSHPPAHWKFIGLSFSSTSVNGTFFLVGFNPNGTAANSSQIADDITFDRDYLYTPSVYTTQSVLDMIRGDVTNLTVKNCFFGDGFYIGDIESHGLRMLTTAGPVTATNNFITTSGIPIFAGGATPSYATYLENGLTAQYNYFMRPWKWNRDPAQPFAADYVTAAQNSLRTGPYTITNVSNTGLVTVSSPGPWFPGSLLTITGVGGCTVANAANWRTASGGGTTAQLLNFPGCNSAYTSGGTMNEYGLTVCTKNLGEFKWGTGITWQYNVGQNSWWANQCQAQFTGFTDTLRTQWDWNVTTPSIGVFTITNSTHVNWSGAYVVGAGSNANIGDMALCLSMPTTGGECHAGTVSGSTFTLSTPLSATPGGSLNGWIVYTGSAKLENVAATHNVWINVDSAWSFLALSYANGVGDAGFGKTHNFSQNLVYANNSYISGYKGIGLTAAESDDSWNPTGFTFDHNTIYYPNGLANGSFVYINGEGCSSNCATSIQPKFASSAITNNLFGVSAAGGNGPFSGDGTPTIGDTTNAYLATSNVKNNALPGATIGPGASGGNAISGNQLQAWVNPFVAGSFTVAASSPYYHAGTDGASLGADTAALPLITNLSVAPASTTASLTFTVAAPIADIKNTQVCALEVSTNRNLQSDLGTYSVITSLDPTITPGADLSTQSGVTIAGNNVTWAITGLTNSTFYYGRLQCYGDTEWFTFTTGTSPGACSISPTTLGPWTNTQAISQTMTTTCSGGTITWTSSGLPAGLSGCNGVTGSSCLLSGTLSAAAIYSPTITATASNVASISPPVIVNAVPSISTVTLPNATSGMAYSQALSISGGTSPFTCSVSSGTLAGSGLNLGPSCTVAGTPTSTVATYSFTARVTDTNGVSATRPLTVSVTGSPCDLNGDGLVNVQDTQLAVNMSLSIIPCTANINGANVCNTVTIQRVVTASLGGACTVGP